MENDPSIYNKYMVNFYSRVCMDNTVNYNSMLLIIFNHNYKHSV